MIATLARQQQGYVATRQLIARGLTRRQVEARVARAVLHPTPFRGVWASGPPRVTPTARWWAAVLACGPGAALGGASAGVCWQVTRGEGATVTVLAPHGTRRRRHVRVHPVRTLADEDVVLIDGLRVTSLARTIVDLAGVLTHTRLVGVLSAAESRHQLDVDALHDVLARTRARAPRLATLAALEETSALGLTLTDSELELALLDLCHAHHLPRPATQAVLAGHPADAYWADARLVVEADGYRFHRDAERFRADRALDRRRSALGLTTLRFTHGDVVHRAVSTAGDIRAALDRAGAPASP